jgi:hypothetical protein
MWRILVPLNFLRIRHAEKWKFDALLPALFCALFSSPLLLTLFRAEALGKFDLLGKAVGTLGLLAGFYITALAAIATFARAEMDEPMPGPVILPYARVGVAEDEELTRRRFLSFLFGYLGLLALALAIVGSMFLIVDTFALQEITWRETAFVAFWIPFSFALGNLLSNTLLGLFYLTDRMHRPNHVLRWRQPPSAPAE